VSTAKSTIERIRNRRIARRDARAIERAMETAPSRAVRDEIAVFASRHLA
jgi:hypothetical protein